MTAYADPLPLRTTVVWGQFADVRAIPHRYGDTSGELLAYDAGRRVFVWADHASSIVRAVTVDSQPVLGWRWFNGADSTGQPVTFVEFTQPVDAGAVPAAEGAGKLSATSGAVIDNPADVVLDVLAQIAGLPVTTGQLAEFRAACGRLGLRVGGSLTERNSAQQVVAGVCASVGAVFSPDADGLCHLWPPETGLVGVPVATIGNTAEVSANAVLDAIATVLVINFDVRDGQARQAVTVEAPDAVLDYGRRERVVDAPWIADARVALDVANRLLRDAARPAWAITAAGVKRRLRCGEWVTVSNARLPVSGTALVLSSSVDLNTATSAITVRLPVGAVPRIALVRQSSQTPADVYASATLDTQGEDRVLTLQDADGRPLANARATLNGQWPRFSDAGGRVTFPASIMPRGSHLIEVTGQGTTLSFTVVVQ